MAGGLQDWKSQKKPFAAIATVPMLWLALFFVAPMAIVWLYSFGENVGPASIDVSGTLDNYKRATEWLYLSIFLKSLAVAALTTLICLIIGFPVAMAITFAAPKWRPWLLLGIMLPFWTNLLDPHLCVDGVDGDQRLYEQGAWRALGIGQLAANVGRDAAAGGLDAGAVALQ